MASPWAVIQTNNNISFEEIAAEELIKSQQEREFKKYSKKLPPEPEVPPKMEDYPLDGTESDSVIAQLLQNQYNREYDHMLKKTEEKLNGRSKVHVSYSNYRTGTPMEPEENTTKVDEDEQLDRFVSVEKEYADIKRRGYKKVGEGSSEIVTKHDMLMSSRINACRVLEFPSGIETGDMGGFDAKLNNKVFNSLRAHSHAHCSREKAKARPHAK